MENDERSHSRGTHRPSDGRFDPTRTGSLIFAHGGLELACVLLLRTSLELAGTAGSFGGHDDSSVGVSLCHKIVVRTPSTSEEEQCRQSKERTSDLYGHGPEMRQMRKFLYSR